MAADFPAIYNTEPDKSGPMPAAEAAARMDLPPGFKAQVFASEPDVQNPIAMTWDTKGRLWVAENYTYAEAPRRFDMNLRDRILIFEDTDGDGKFDKRTVFTDEVQMLTSIEVGLGGVWAVCPPQVIFIPDKNGDDKPDGPAEVVLDGFTVPQESYHNFANGIRLGPDGWLYGRVGATAIGAVGVPGTPKDERIPVVGGMWRYHPQRKIFETLTAGCTNPWGHDWNEYGELFHVNTVNGHLWHAFSGAHFVRAHTVDPNPHVYGLIDMHADHWHFDTGKSWSDSRNGVANAFGGGHSHAGTMIYLGDNWPEQFRGHLYTLNQHGRRANQEILERTGSGYVAKHGHDFFIAADTWFRGIDINYGPDGGVYVIDWSDTGECHERNGINRTSGRIFKISYGTPKKPAVTDLSKLSNDELVKLHLHPNEWYARMARKELLTRAYAGQSLVQTIGQLRGLYAQQKDAVMQLRLLWTLYDLGGANNAFLRAQLKNPNEHVRAWAIRLLRELWPNDTVNSERPARFGEVKFKGDDFASQAVSLKSEFARMAKEDPSGLVRLVLASTLQRLPTWARSDIAVELVAHKEDAHDHNLPMLIWYGLIPVAETNPADLIRVASKCEIPLTRQYIARRLAEDIEKNPGPLNALLKQASSAGSKEALADMLTGVAEALNGWRKAAKPAVWDTLAKQWGKYPLLSNRIRELSVVFGDGRALDEVKKVALDHKADLTVRKAALQTLIDNKSPDLKDICEVLLNERFLNPLAARGLATFDDPGIGERLVKSYRSFHQSERPQLIATLVSRASFVPALLKAIGEGKIPRSELSAYNARQIRSYNNEALNKRLTEVWGEMREPAADKKALIAKLKAFLTPEVLAKADKSAGREIFTLACAVCHHLYGQGGEVGPDLTGAGRDNLDYILDNVADPSAVVSADFRMSVVTFKDGRVLNGIIAAKTDRTITLKTMTEKVTAERSEIESIKESNMSLMPEGLLESLTEEQVRNLVGYLMTKSQVPLPAGGTN